MKKNIDMYAFWTYDQYPHLLGGKIIESKEKNMVCVEGYEGYVIPYAFILKGERGKMLAAVLKELENWYKEECLNLRNTFKERLLNTVPKNKHKFFPSHLLLQKSN